MGTDEECRRAPEPSLDIFNRVTSSKKDHVLQHWLFLLHTCSRHQNNSSPWPNSQCPLWKHPQSLMWKHLRQKITYGTSNNTNKEPQAAAPLFLRLAMYGAG